MTADRALSRPLRLATLIAGGTTHGMRSRLDNAIVHVRLDPEFADAPDAAVLLVSLVDQLSRFCGTVTVSAPGAIAAQCIERDRALHETPRVLMRGARGARRHVAVDVTVGRTPGVAGGVATCSDGWLAKFTTITDQHLGLAFVQSNPIGALAAAAMTAGEVFLRVIGLTRSPRVIEFSAWTGECASLGTLTAGPAIPILPEIDGLLVGCGNVMNGWTVAAHALGLTGHVHAVDRQLLADENLGPYALARHDMLGEPKTLLVAQHLRPQFAVTPHDEELDLFVPRITRWTLPLPKLVINGLDEVVPRHLVQRLWPDMLIDMAAGGATSQVLVHRRGAPGQCLLGAFAAPDETTYTQRVEALTGLRPDRFLHDFNTPLTDDDVAAAPAEHRARLQAAAEKGQLVCGYVNQASLTSTTEDNDFAPAAPFVGALTGVRAAALTVALLLGERVPSGLHWQYSFLSNRARNNVMRCAVTCECNRVTP